jgi:hypothetical protein
MAFCSNCGNQLEGNERFCVKCGSDVSAKTGAEPAGPVAPAGGAGPRLVPSTPMQPVPPVTAMPGPYAAPGAMPASYAAPVPVPVQVAIAQQPPAKKGVTFGTLAVVAALALGGYYYYTHDYMKDHPPAASKSQPQTGTAAALGKQQAFDAHWQTVNGYVQLSNGKWTNNANVAVQTSTLECDQYDLSGNLLDQMRTTLNGPVQPGGTDTFNPFTVGAVANHLNRVTCTILYAKAVGQ